MIDNNDLFTIETTNIDSIIKSNINELIDSNINAAKIVPQLIKYDNNFYNNLNLLLYFNIKGKELVTFFNKICNANINTFSETISVLKDTTKINDELVFTHEDIKNNLAATNPIPFLNNNIEVSIKMSLPPEKIRLEIINYYIKLKENYKETFELLNNENTLN